MTFPFDEQKAKVADFYSRVAPIYDHIGPTVFSYFGQCMVELASIPSGAHILDIATGRGANLFASAERVGATGKVVGIDIAHGMVHQTNNVIQSRGLKNAIVLHMDAEHLTFADNTFDYALCNFAIFWLPHLEQALTEFFRVLRPHGRFGVTLPGGNDERWRWYQDLMNEYFQRFHVSLPPLSPPTSVSISRQPDTFQNLMSQIGFTQIRSIPVEGEMVYTNEQEWWDAKWMHGERYPLENMPAEMLAQFKTDVMKHIVSLKQDNGFHERWYVLCMFGNKPETHTIPIEERDGRSG